MAKRIEFVGPTLYWPEGYKVFLRERSLDPWEEVTGLYCNWFTTVAAPSISSAEFERRYGTGIEAGEAVFGYKDYLNRGTWGVKVEVNEFDDEGNQLIWSGIIEVDGDNPDGSANDQPMGAQKFLAYGPEIFSRSTITSTYAWVCAQAGNEEARIYEGIPFNEFNRVVAADRLAKKEFHNRPGNRSRTMNPAGIYPFADPDEANQTSSMAAWEVPQIVEYLLYYHGPREQDGTKSIVFELQSDEYLPTGICHEVRQHGRTVKEILDQLMDRRRLVSYVVEPSAGNPDQFSVRPFSFLDEQIDLGDMVIWENADQKELIVDESVLVSGLHVQESWAQFYHRVVAVGAPIVCCGTFSNYTSLQGYWATTEAQAYATAATTTVGYSALQIYEREQRDVAMRTEERFERVYTTFGLPKTTYWSNCGDNHYGGGTQTIFPAWLFGDAQKCSAPFDATDTFVYLPTLKLDKVLPLRSDHDYRNNLISSDLIGDNTPLGGTWHYLAPLVILNLKNPDQMVNYYCDIAQSGALAHCETMGYGPGVEFSASVHFPEDSAFFQLKINGAPQHLLAGADYTALKPAAIDYDEMGPLFNWRTDLLATLAIETNCRVQMQWPATVDVETDHLRTLFLDLSDYAALHYVAPNTVVAIENGQLIRSTSGGIVRDDRPLLTRMARLAYEWYSRRRQAISFSYVGARKRFRVGDLITQLGRGATAEPIRSVVTEIRVDFGRNPGDPHKTTIQTQWAELDVLRLIQ